MHRLGRLELRAGNLERARAWYRRALSIQERVWTAAHRVNRWALYRLACIEALEGGHDRALALLRQAVDCGLDDEALLEHADLASLRGVPEFESIVAEVRKRGGSQNR